MHIILALKNKQAVMLGSGEGVWNRLHVADLVDVYCLLVQRVLDAPKHSEEAPSGKDGYYFAEHEQQSWRDVATHIGHVGKEKSVFGTSHVKSIGLEQPAAEFFDGDTVYAERLLGSKYDHDLWRIESRWLTQTLKLLNEG